MQALEVATTLDTVAEVLGQRGSLDEAIQLHRILLHGQRYPEAEELLAEVLARRRRAFGEGHIAVAQSLGNLAWVKQLREDYEAAEALQLQSIEAARQALGPRHPDVANPLVNADGAGPDPP